MKIDLKPGTYVVAVSGGVDSMALLDLLVKKAEGLKQKAQSKSPNSANLQPSVAGLKLIVAHFDHGIRPDSAKDRKLVQKFAEKHGLPFVHYEGKLGPNASEEAARKARYEFLHKVREAAHADAILTAHHQDDAVETATHNILRGTGRKGLSSLKNTKHVKRPLLHLPKHELKSYAEDRKLKWREDTTNNDLRYIRNYIRHQVLPRLTLEEKASLLTHIQKARTLNQKIDTAITTLSREFLQSGKNDRELKRQQFIKLPYIIAREVMAAWLRRNGIRDFDRKMVEQLVVAAKTYTVGKAAHVGRDRYLLIEKTKLALKDFER